MFFMSLLNTICSQLHKSIWATFINGDKLASPPLKFFSFFSLYTIHKANRNMIKPWPQSPNMTAKRNGNVMMVNRAVCRKKVKKKTTTTTTTKFICKIEWKATYIDILKVLYINFFLVGYAILKDFSYLFRTKFTSRNSTCDIMTIDQ